ncbi:MAG: PQQ-binding-like beta-propeller repeat protein, partial [Pseudomonadales bacterium]|nr:PQQ-binding-like beta-propeller repeat protein [Pseudomonadales bacterium]
AMIVGVRWSICLATMLCCLCSAMKVVAAPDGEQLYTQHCGVCHDAPGDDRTPPRAQLTRTAAPDIYRQISVGTMAPMAAMLGESEKRAIALYLSPGEGSRGRASDPDVNMIWGESSAELPMAGPMCKAPPSPVDLKESNQWNGWSPTKDNARYQRRPGLNVDDVPRLKVKWAFRYPGSKNGQATVIGDRLFVTSMSGAIYALNAKTGCVYWRHDAGWPTRTSVSIGPILTSEGTRHALYYSDWSKSAVAIDAETGTEIWRTRIEDATGVQMTGSPTLWKNKLFVPISTGNEAFAANDDYECCKFIGSVVALDATTGKILWKRYTTDQPNLPYRKNAKGQQMWGPAGGSIWSAPTVDPERGLIYVATSNSHTDMPHDGSDAVIAIDVETGKVVWKNQLWKDDNYIIGCPRAANCPRDVGPDFALGASPILHTAPDGHQLILAGQKSGILWALDPNDSGRVVWKTRLSPGSALGGIVFGPAADDTRVYVGISDVITREDARPGLYALNIADGSLVWRADAPSLTCRWKNRFCFPGVSQAVTTIPGVVFAGAMNGRFRAYDSATGKVIWEHDTGGTPMRSVLGEDVYGGVMDGAGPTIAGGMVYVTSGYAGRQNEKSWDMRGRRGNVLIAYSVDGE